MIKNSKKIFIYGVPGTGKTRFSELLGKQLHVPVIEADSIKKKARKNIPRSENPFLYVGTCLAYHHFGELSQENAIKGLLSVRNALREAVEQEVKNYPTCIIEGAFLDPVKEVVIQNRTYYYNEKTKQYEYLP